MTKQLFSLSALALVMLGTNVFANDLECVAKVGDNNIMAKIDDNEVDISVKGDKAPMSPVQFSMQANNVMVAHHHKKDAPIDFKAELQVDDLGTVKQCSDLKMMWGDEKSGKPMMVTFSEDK